eukprot:TRINITY_DN1224_c0_g2_i1.p1 TRINITY_DN1224_c0_g2~~TRINITY_DN1224_c0_g2_i1.p1  ORF type:complete len:803 (+),score=275.13 TRINITY_DN1224_c0_g2_i1:599-3007(+)
MMPNSDLGLGLSSPSMNEYVCLGLQDYIVGENGLFKKFLSLIVQPFDVLDIFTGIITNPIQTFQDITDEMQLAGFTELLNMDIESVNALHTGLPWNPTMFTAPGDPLSTASSLDWLSYDIDMDFGGGSIGSFTSNCMPQTLISSVSNTLNVNEFPKKKLAFFTVPNFGSPMHSSDDLFKNIHSSFYLFPGGDSATQQPSFDSFKSIIDSRRISSSGFGDLGGLGGLGGAGGLGGLGGAAGSGFGGAGGDAGCLSSGGNDDFFVMFNNNELFNMPNGCNLLSTLMNDCPMSNSFLWSNFPEKYEICSYSPTCKKYGVGFVNDGATKKDGIGNFFQMDFDIGESLMTEGTISNNQGSILDCNQASQDFSSLLQPTTNSCTQHNQFSKGPSNLYKSCISDEDDPDKLSQFIDKLTQLKDKIIDEFSSKVSLEDILNKSTNFNTLFSSYSDKITIIDQEIFTNNQMLSSITSKTNNLQNAISPSSFSSVSQGIDVTSVLSDKLLSDSYTAIKQKMESVGDISSLFKSQELTDQLNNADLLALLEEVMSSSSSFSSYSSSINMNQILGANSLSPNLSSFDPNQLMSISSAIPLSSSGSSSSFMPSLSELSATELFNNDILSQSNTFDQSVINELINNIGIDNFNAFSTDELNFDQFSSLESYFDTSNLEFSSEFNSPFDVSDLTSTLSLDTSLTLDLNQDQFSIPEGLDLSSVLALIQDNSLQSTSFTDISDLTNFIQSNDIQNTIDFDQFSTNLDITQIISLLEQVTGLSFSNTDPSSSTITNNDFIQTSINDFSSQFEDFDNLLN